MDPPQSQPTIKRLAEQRREITPGNDDTFNDDDVDDQICSSDEQQSYYKQPSKNIKDMDEEQEQRWDDVPTRQRGQTQALQPIIYQSNTVQHGQQYKQTAKQQQQSQPNQPQQLQQSNNKNPNQPQQSQQSPNKPNHPKQKQSPKSKANKNSKKYLPIKQLKYKTMNIDSKFVFAAYYLLRKQFKQLLPPSQGFIRFNPYINNKNILIYYYQQQKVQQIINKIDQYIDSIQVMQMGKKQAESGVQLSYKYIQNLYKQNIAIFKDKTQNYKTQGYYICGRVTKKILYQKLSEIKNINFGWLNMFRYQNTRSYRAILRKIFDTTQVQEFMMEKYKARQVQVGYRRSDYNIPNVYDKKGILIVLTYVGQKKLAIHQQIQQTLSNFINQTFAVFCFTFFRKKQNFVQKYTPKVDKVIWFFIVEHNTEHPINYLYIIVKRNDFQIVRDTIIMQIQDMKLIIKGRRFFRNISPDKNQVDLGRKCRMFCYPKSYPYSWTLLAPNKQQDFDWKSQLML